MEQGERNLVLGEQGSQGFLGPVLCPGRAEKAGILGRIGIPDHDLLPTGHTLPVERHGQQRAHGSLCAFQIIQRLEQRHHSHGLTHACDLLQQHDRQHIRRRGGHGNHIGTEPFTALLGNHLAGIEDFPHFRGTLIRIAERGIHQRPARLQLLDQKGLPTRLVPFAVTAQLQITGNRIQRIPVAGRFLADIQPQQGNAETVQAPQGIFQIAIGNIGQPGFPQRTVYQQQRRQQLLTMSVAIAIRYWLIFNAGLELATGQLQATTHVAQQHTVGLMTRARHRQQLITGHLHGQIRQQLFDIPQVEISRHPAGQQQHLTGHRRGHIGVAVAIASHPRRQFHRRPVCRRLRQPLLHQLTLKLADHVWHRLPQRLFNGGEAPFGFIHGGRLFAANLIRSPGRQNHPAQACTQGRALFIIKIRPVQLAQQVRDLIVFTDQGATGHFSGVCREHQLHRQASQGIGKGLGRDLLLGQALQHITQPLVTSRITRVALVLTMQSFTVVLLGNVAEIEELAKRSGHFQQGVIVQWREQVPKGRQRCATLAARGHRGLADLLNGVEQAIARLLSQALTQQVAQQTNIVP